MAKDRPVKLSFSLIFQVKYCLTVAVVFVVSCGLLYMLLDKALGGGYRQSLRTLYYLDQNLPLYLSIMALLLTIFILVLTLVVTLLVSHQVAGPVFRYEDVLKKMIAGVFPSRVATRQTDQLKTLVDSLNKLTDRCRETFHSADELSKKVEGLALDSLEVSEKGALLEQVVHLRDQMGAAGRKRGGE